MVSDGSNNTSDDVYLITGGYDHTIRIWQAHTGMCQRIFQYAGCQVNDVDISPDRQVVAAAGYQTIRLYNMHSSKAEQSTQFEGLSKNVTSVGFHEDGRWIWTGGEDCYVRIWDLRQACQGWPTSSDKHVKISQCQRIFQAHDPVNCVCIHPNQGELYIGDQSGVIHVWDLRTDHNEQLVTDSDVSIQHIDIDPEGTYMAAIDNKGSCYIYSLTPGTDDRTSQPLRKLKLLAHSRYGLKCRFSPDSTLLATTSADTTARIWRMADLLPLMDQKEKMSPIINYESEVHVYSSKGWKIAEASPMIELKAPNQRWVWDIAFSADSQYVITASSDNMVRLWSIATGDIKREYSGHQKAVTALAFRDGS